MFNPQDDSKIMEAIDRLCMAQGKNKLSLDQMDFFIQEMSKWHLPVNNIVAGIENLFSTKMRDINLPEIRQAASNQTANIYQEKYEHIPFEEKKYNMLYISKLRGIYGNDWFKHFNYPNYDTPMMGPNDLKRIAIERWGIGWEKGIMEAKNPLKDLIPDPIVGSNDAIEPIENLRKDIYG